MAAKRHVDVVIHELFDIYFNVIPHFNMIFNAEFISEASSNFEVSLKNKSKMAAIWCLIGSKSIVISIWDTYKLLNL